MRTATTAQELFLHLATHAKIHDRLDRIGELLERQEEGVLLRDAVDAATIRQRIAEVRF